ncbi:MAG TPA: hypothetical protein VFY12_07420, partial [Arenimonas sp.]|nr:hypothetical protein [Arenimonas sp.]
APEGGAVVDLSSANMAIAVPDSVTVPQGQSSAAFPISTSAVSATTMATLSATYAGISKTTVFTAEPAAPVPDRALDTLTLWPQTVVAPATSTGSVTLTAPAPAGGLTVSLKSAKPRIAAVPSSVTVAAGATSASFPITVSARRKNASVVITASHAGVTRQAMLSIKPR